MSIVGNCGINITWELNDDGCLTLSGTGPTYEYGTVPWNDYKEQINSIIVEDGITRLGKYLFYDCKNAVSVTLPNTLTSVDYLTFYDWQSSIKDTNIEFNTYGEINYLGNNSNNYLCLVHRISNVTSNLIIHSETKVIADHAFQYSRLKKIFIDNNVEYIGEQAFNSCSELKNVSIGPKTIKVGKQAFSECKNIANIFIFSRDVDIYDSEDTFPVSAVIYGYTNSTAEKYAKKYNREFITIQYGQTVNNDFVYYITEQGALIIVGEGNVSKEALGQSLNYYKKNIKSIILTEGLTKIESNTFQEYNSLKKVIVPTSMNIIDSKAFYNCNELESIVISSNRTSINTEDALPEQAIIYGLSNSNAKTYAENYSRTFVEMYKIGTCGPSLYWFLSGNNLNTLNIIGTGRMENFITDTAMPWYTMKEQILKVVVDEDITSISSYAFYWCTKIESVILPDSLTNIETNAFQTGVTNIYKDYENSQYLGTETNPYKYLIKYKGGQYTSYKIHPDTKLIAGDAFRGRDQLQEIKLPEGLKYICKGAFSYSDGLTKITIPKSVEVIGSSAFSSCSSLKELILEDGIKNIENNAFDSCEKLTEITIPSSVTYIRKKAFYYCTGLKKINIKKGVLGIEDGAFEATHNLINVNIPSSIIFIHPNAFHQWNSRDENKINVYGFQGTPAEDICKVTTDFVFKGDELNSGSNGSIHWKENADYELIIDGTGELGGLVLPQDAEILIINNGITSIANSCFNNYNTLKEVKIPKTVKIIGVSAFIYCSNLEKVIIEEGVENIGSIAFGYCPKLKLVSLPDSIRSATAPFVGCDNLDYNEYNNIEYLGNNDNPYVYLLKVKTDSEECTIHQDTRIIGYQSFSNCNSLQQITIPGNVFDINEAAFESCSNLSTIKILSEDTKLCDSDSLIPNSTIIYGYENSPAQNYANKYNRTFNKILTEHNYVIQHNSDIHWEECEDCHKKINVEKHIYSNENLYQCEKCNYNNETKLNQIFGTNNLQCVLFSNGELVISGNGDIDDYILSDTQIPWTNYVSDIKTIIIEEGVTSIGEYTFYGCLYATSILIPKTVKTIKFNCLQACYNLTNITIDSENQFYYSKGNCIIEKNIGKVIIGCGVSVIPEEVVSIGYGAFHSQGLKHITIPENITFIDQRVFQNCIFLEEIEFLNEITNINEGMFYGCKNLKQIKFSNDKVTDTQDNYTFPTNITEIKSAAFFGCENLFKDLKFSKNIIEIGRLAFANCKDITSITVDSTNPNYYSESNCLIRTEDKALILGCNESQIPNEVKSISNYAFSNCEEIKNIEIPNGVTKLGVRCFLNCINLLKVNIPTNITTIYTSCFRNCKSLKEIFIPENITSIEFDAFGGCSNLEKIIITSKNTQLNFETTIPISTKIYGYEGSEAQKYAKKYSRNFIELKANGKHGEFLWFLTTDGEFNIKGQGEMPYLENPSWYEFRKIIKTINIEEGITSISRSAFVDCSVTNINFPNSLSSIDSTAFESCNYLTYLVIPKGVISIGESAFIFCSNLKSVILNEDTTLIDHYAFAYCPKLKKIVILSQNARYYTSSISDTSLIYAYVNPAGAAAVPKNFRRIKIDCNESNSEGKLACDAYNRGRMDGAKITSERSPIWKKFQPGHSAQDCSETQGFQYWTATQWNPLYLTMRVSDAYKMFYCSHIPKIFEYPMVLDTSTCRSLESMCEDSDVEYFGNTEFHIDAKGKSIKNMFKNCRNLKHIYCPIEVDANTNFDGAFDGCAQLENLTLIFNKEDSGYSQIINVQDCPKIVLTMQDQPDGITIITCSTDNPVRPNTIADQLNHATYSIPAPYENGYNYFATDYCLQHEQNNYINNRKGEGGNNFDYGYYGGSNLDIPPNAPFTGISEEDFNPIVKDIRPAYAWRMFRNSTIENLIDKVKIDFSQSRSINTAFEYCSKLKHVGTVCGDGQLTLYEYADIFNGCSSLTTIDLIQFNNKHVIAPRMFRRCSSLTTINFDTENNHGIFYNISFVDCPKLSNDSLINILNALQEPVLVLDDSPNASDELRIVEYKQDSNIKPKVYFPTNLEEQVTTLLNNSSFTNKPCKKWEFVYQDYEPVFYNNRDIIQAVLQTKL